MNYGPVKVEVKETNEYPGVSACGQAQCLYDGMWFLFKPEDGSLVGRTRRGSNPYPGIPVVWVSDAFKAFIHSNFSGIDRLTIEL